MSRWESLDVSIEEFNLMCVIDIHEGSINHADCYKTRALSLHRNDTQSLVVFFVNILLYRRPQISIFTHLFFATFTILFDVCCFLLVGSMIQIISPVLMAREDLSLDLMAVLSQSK